MINFSLVFRYVDLCKVEKQSSFQSAVLSVPGKIMWSILVVERQANPRREVSHGPISTHCLYTAKTSASDFAVSI